MTPRIVRPLDNPIDDLFTALDLLVRRDYRTGGYLCLSYRMRGCHDVYGGPRIVRESMGGYADMTVTAERVYYLTDALATKLELDRFTRGTPQWGYTDQSIRHVTDYGEREHWRMREEIGSAANALGDFLKVSGSAVQP